MSGSLPSGRRLLWRVGKYRSARRPLEPVESTCSIVFELVETETGQIVGAEGLSAIAWRPRLGGFEAQAVPLIPRLLSPGTWQVDFVAEMPGTYCVQAVTLGEASENTVAKIEIR